MRKQYDHDISLKDKFILSPIEKHIHYRKFPYRLILHLTLVILTTLQVSSILDSGYTIHARNQFQVFKYIFLGSENQENTVEFLTLEDFQGHLKDVMKDLRTLDKQLFQNYRSAHTNYSMGVLFTRANYRNYNFLNASFPVNISSNHLGPIDISDISSIKEFLSSIAYAYLQINEIITLVSTGDGTTSCMAWNLTLSYNVESLTTITAEIAGNNRYCTQKHVEFSPMLQDLQQASLSLNVLVVVVAAFSFILSLKHILSVAKIYMATKILYKQRQAEKAEANQNLDNLTDHDKELKGILDNDVTWQNLPMHQKLKFFNLWFVFALIGNAIQILGGVSVILSFTKKTGQSILVDDNVLFGFGCFFAWCQLMYYLKFDRDIILMPSTIAKSMVENLVLFGILIPAFVGFTIVGEGFFWEYSLFANTEVSMRSLFGMFCGDIVYDAFMDTRDEGVYKQIYLVVFLLCFYTGAQNIFVAFIMEGYDRCSVRKEIDNDDPFPVLDSLVGSIKKEDEKGPRQFETSFDASILYPESDPAQGCINRLLGMKAEINRLISDINSTYKEKDTISFSVTDKNFLHDLYYEQINQLLMKLQYYDFAFSKN